MRIGIYSPYFDTAGGGERYLLTFAEYCLQRGWQVEIFWPEREKIFSIAEKFNIKLDSIIINTKIAKYFSLETSYLGRILKHLSLRKYDLLFFLSNGSIPNMSGKQNWLHFQMPFIIEGKNFSNRLKFSKIQHVICNSNFTKKFIDKSFGINSEVFYPPVAVHDFKPSNLDNEKIILNVGRFDQVFEGKRQDVLIEAFKKMVDDGLQDWWLVLAGSSSLDKGELLRLRELAIGYPVDFQINISYEELLSWYHRASIYWHANGFEVDEEVQPIRTEHFGMSIVEAMAVGCLVVAYDAGGVSEIVADKKDGYLWKTKDQLIKISQNLVNEVNQKSSITESAADKAEQFSKEAFFVALDKLLPV